MDRPEAWLTTVAVNLATSKLRRRSAERRAVARAATRTVGSEPFDTADAMSVRAALLRLPIRQRTALVLRYYEDLSVAETARVMGCADGTVKSLTSKAVDALRRLDESWSVPSLTAKSRSSS
jgi:RNA polymerase sigma factor (sigma-70 family)